jgi:hypothetical protein
LIAAPEGGYTFNAVALVFITRILAPAGTVGRITPVLALTVLTTLIGLVSVVAVPCVEPAAVMPVVTPYDTKPPDAAN